MRQSAHLCAVIFAFACSHEAEPIALDRNEPPSFELPDAGSVSPGPESFTVEVEDPLPPDTPLPPLWSCPSGWRDTSAEGEIECDPFPSDGRATCAPGEAHLPGTAGCAPVDAPCEGDYATDLPPGPTLYVEAGTLGGTGTMSEPYGSIGIALAVATSGNVVAVARGVYEETVVVPAGVTLWGACTAETVIRAPAGAGAAATVRAAGPDVSLGRLRLSGPAKGLLVEGDGSSVRIEGLRISGASEPALTVEEGASLTGNGLLIEGTYDASRSRGGRAALVRGALSIRQLAVLESEQTAVEVRGEASSLSLTTALIADTAPLSSGPLADTAGEGLRLADGGRAFLTETVIEGSGARNLHVEQGASVEAQHLILRGARGSSLGLGGSGALVETGGTLSATHFLIEQNRAAGVRGVGEGTSIHLTDGTIRDQLGEGTGLLGRGIDASSQARITATRVVIARNHLAGLAARSLASYILEDVVVADTNREVRDGGDGGYGIALDRASLHAMRLEVRDGVGYGVRGNTASTIELDHATFRDVRPHGNGLGGRGIEVVEESSLVLRRAALSGLREAAIVIANTTTAASLSDVAIRGTRSNGDGFFGRAVEIQAAGMEATRLFLEDNEDAALAVEGSERVVLENLGIVGTRSRRADGLYGRGINAQSNANVLIRRGRLEENRDIAIFMDSSRLDAQELLILDTQPVQGVEVAGPVSMRDTHGRALSLQEGAEGTLTRARLERNHEVAVAVFGQQSLLDLTDVLILDTRPQECALGFCPSPARPQGISLGSYDGARVFVARFEIAGSALAGVQIAHGEMLGTLESFDLGGRAHLRDGILSGHPVGVNVQTEDVDIDDLVERVVFRDNQRNLDADSLPTPSTGIAF